MKPEIIDKNIILIYEITIIIFNPATTTTPPPLPAIYLYTAFKNTFYFSLCFFV
jgi:hypothetical protein